MKMVRSNQFGPLGFGNLLEDLISGNHNRFFRDDAGNQEMCNTLYQVPVNVIETESGYTMSVIAPGVAKEEIKLNINNKELTISFEHTETEKQEGEKWLRKEYKARSFKRSFTLGEKIDEEKIEATYNNGILNISLPKKEAVIATNKVIDIK